MTSKQRMEDLSITFLSAIAAQASIEFERMHHDADSTDCILKKRVNLSDGRLFNAELRVQLKSTASKNYYSIGDKSVKYKLNAKNYRDMQLPSTSEIILALLILPEETEQNWVEWTEEELLIHGQMYWTCLRQCEPTESESTVTVEFPKNNTLHAEALENLLERIANDGVLL